MSNEYFGWNCGEIIERGEELTLILCLLFTRDYDSLTDFLIKTLLALILPFCIWDNLQAESQSTFVQVHSRHHVRIRTQSFILENMLFLLHLYSVYEVDGIKWKKNYVALFLEQRDKEIIVVFNLERLWYIDVSRRLGKLLIITGSF